MAEPEHGDREREHLRTRATELDCEIASARGELAEKRAQLERGEHAPVGAGRRGVGDFGHLIAGVLLVLAVLLAAWLRSAC
jgi:hypothetical protein